MSVWHILGLSCHNIWVCLPSGIAQHPVRFWHNTFSLRHHDFPARSWAESIISGHMSHDMVTRSAIPWLCLAWYAPMCWLTYNYQHLGWINHNFWMVESRILDGQITSVSLLVKLAFCLLNKLFPCQISLFIKYGFCWWSQNFDCTFQSNRYQILRVKWAHHLFLG